MSSSERTSTFARREAQPIPWGELNDDQKRAVEGTARILADLSKQARTQHRNKHLDLFLPTIERDRLNHVVLLDGERGSGKTALLVTLLDAWSRMLRGQESTLQPKLEPKLEPELVAALEGTKNVVPVGLIDLQPLPRSTNLLLYLVGRFQRVVEAIEQVHGDRGNRRTEATTRHLERAPWTSTGAEEPRSKQCWRDFVQATALGWTNDGMDKRREKLDPEAFVLEVEQAERRRLDVVSSFRALIDALVDEYPQLNAGPEGEPLFLLAIDDADMNPEKAEELLDLVRTLWHPRVAFLLTGDTNLFLSILRNRVNESIHDEALAKDLVVDMYNKLIPPAHRFGFPRFPPQKRLGQLQGSLKKLRAPKGALEGFGTLDELFGANEQLQELLPSRERAMADLRVRIANEIAAATSRREKANEEEQNQPAPEEATRHVLAALCRAAYWPLQASALLPDYGFEQDILRAAREIRRFEWHASTANALYFPNGKDRSLVVQPTPRFEATMLDAKKGEPEEVPPNAIAASMIAGDVIDGWHGHYVELPPVPDLGLMGAVVRTEYKMERKSYGFAWPLPAWRSFADYLDFGKWWHEQVPDKRKPFDPNQVDTIARRFVHAIVSRLSLKGAKQVPAASSAWESLAREVSKLASNKGDAAAAGWAVARAGLFAAPESGLGPDAAKQWLDALEKAFKARWKIARTALENERLARVRSVADRGRIVQVDAIEAKKVLGDIDAANLDHPWVKKFGPHRGF